MIFIRFLQFYSHRKLKRLRLQCRRFLRQILHSKFYLTLLQVLHWHGLFFTTFDCNIYKSERRKLRIDSLNIIILYTSRIFKF